MTYTQKTVKLKTLKSILLSTLLLLMGGFIFGQSQKMTLVEVGQELTFRNTSNGADSWFWDFGDGNVSTEWHGRHIFQTPGEYTIHLVVNSGSCSKVTTQTLKVTEPLNPGGMLENIQLYPNPVVDYTHLDLPYQFAGEVNFSLLDKQGKKVQAWTENVRIGQGNLTLDFQGLAAGLYFLDVQSGTESATLRVVKQ